MSRRFSSKARKATARSAPRPRETHHDVETVRQSATEVSQVKNGALALKSCFLLLTRIIILPDFRSAMIPGSHDLGSPVFV